jgi:putative NIF3 family GTP cyclohydrolase 1 type 2
MEAKELYQRLESDFVLAGMEDTPWASAMVSFQDLLSDQFKKRSMGLLFDFTAEIKQVRTAVFPSEAVLRILLDEGLSDTLLFLHHPAIWDIRRPEGAFYQIDRKLLERFKALRISVFAFHVPLDNFGKYSTSVSLARALEIDVGTAFSPYGGGLCGVFGKSRFLTAKELQEKYSEVVGHKTKLYPYGPSGIVDAMVAVVAGGGNDPKILQEVADRGVSAFVTGVTADNEYARAAHNFAKEKRINILGGTHYSSEAFACRAMCQYFEAMGLPSRFVADEPCMEDM